MINHNIKLLKITNFCGGMWPFTMLAAVYFESITNSYTISLSLLSLVTIIQVITEIPTGVFSDKIGRKQTLVLSSFLQACTALLWAMAGTFNCTELLVIGAILYGIGEALYSGTDEALIYETMKDIKKVNEFENLYSKLRILSQLGNIICACLIAIITYIFPSSNFPFIIIYYVVILISLSEMVCYAMCTNPKKKKNTYNISSFKHFKEGFKLILKNKKLRLFTIVRMFSETSTKTAAKIENIYFMTLMPFYLISIIVLIRYFFGILGSYIAPYFKKYGFGNVIFSLQYLISGIKLFAITLNNFFTPFINSTLKLFNSVSEIAEVSIMQQEFSAKQRATMGSIISFGMEIINAITFVFLGVIADLYSIRIAFFFLIFIKIIIDTFTFIKFKNLKL